MNWNEAEFVEFFAAVNDGCVPYTWQRELARALVTTGRWPDSLVAPTGAGKSAVVDIHVYAVAATANTAIRPPRRLCAVVNRRALVDSQLDRASRIADALCGGATGVLQSVRERLMALTTAGIPLRVVTMRGGLPSDPTWLNDPVTPMVICATPDMWGSRLLFRGYGSTRYARPRESGLLGCDSVMVLDEAHLNTQLLQTARDVETIAAREQSALGLVPSLQVVATTATPETILGEAITADPDSSDPNDAALVRALHAPKRLRFVRAPHGSSKNSVSAKYVDLLATEALGVADACPPVSGAAPTVLCVVNRVETALRVADRLESEMGSDAVVCRVGRTRQLDLELLEKKTPGLFTPRGNDRVRFLVATQTVEVGLDIDCAGLVSELAPGASLVQRFGRVNRRGLRPVAPICVVMPDEPIREDQLPYRAAELLAAQEWLRRIGDGCDVAPASLITEPPPSAGRRRSVVSGLYPEMAELLAQSSDALCAEPDLEFWLRDELDSAPESVGVVLRGPLPDDDGTAMALLRATPVTARELLPTRIGTANDLMRWVFESEKPRAFCWRYGELRQVERGERLKPGDHVVIDHTHRISRRGVVTHDRPDRNDALEVVWGSDDVRVVLPGSEHDDLLTELVGLSPSEAQVRCADRGYKDLQVELPPGDVAFADRLPWLVLKSPKTVSVDAEVQQEWSPQAEHLVTLDAHQQAVGARARVFGELLALPAAMVDALEAAGLHHDDGKDEKLFQEQLRAGDAPNDVVLAKSNSRNAQHVRRRRGTPWRHEQLSAVYVTTRLSSHPLQELIVRLVGTSHGRGRPFFPMGAASLLRDDHPDAVVSAAEQLFLTGEGWADVLERTDRSYGYWGCAYLEAVLRAADCQVSGEGS